MSFAANAITHPVKTYSSFVNSIQMISDLAKDNEWKTLSKILFPEVCELVNNWDSLTPKEKGEKSGYIISKYGADILIPGAAAKAVAQGIKGAKELVVISKNIQRTEELVALETLTGTGGSSGTFVETVYAWKTSEEIIPHSFGILRNIKVFSSITSKSDVLKIIKPNGQWIGKEGTRISIRLFEGGQNEAMQVFKKLTKDGELFRVEDAKKIYKLSDNTYRPISESGPPNY